MKKLGILLKGAAIAFCMITLFVFAVPQDQKAGGSWDVPAKYKSMKNPLKGDAASVAVGKNLYLKHCKACHGGEGLGNGPKAGSMKTKIPSFKEAKFQAQADGAIYYEFVVGRNEMTSFDKKVAEEDDRWALVNYIRTLK